MFVVSTFRDKPSGNILGQELSHIAMDNKVSENTRQFILNHYYLDDGLSKQRLINIKDELPGTFGRYSFAVKYVLLNFQQSAGVTSTQNLEHCLGIVWNFEDDTPTPGLGVFLSKKVCGAHIGEAICLKTIADTGPTQHVVLQVLGSLHDLTGVTYHH